MRREVIVFVVVALALGGAAQACGAPTGDVVPNSPEARATDTRRTAVAEVQRIIANNPTATPLPAPTATPAPTCPNAIWWTEARGHVGEARTIQGTIVASRPAPDGAALLEVGQPYPDPTGLAVLITFAPTLDALNGRTVCLAGRIVMTEGRPTVQLRDATGIVVLQ